VSETTPVTDSPSPTPRESKPKRAPLSRRARALVAAAVTVVVAALLIFGITAISSPKSDSAPQTAELTDAQKSALEYRKANEALQSGDTTAAVQALERAVVLDPSNTQAQQALDRITTPSPNQSGGSSSGGSGGSGETTSKPKPAEPEPEPVDPAFLKPVTPLTKLLPARATDFSLGTATGTKTDATVSGDPTEASSPASRSLWTVHDRKNQAGAGKFITSVSKELYGKDGQDVVIDGTKAYFGTDGTRFATVVYVRGRYVFEVVLTSPSGSPKQLRTEAQKAAKAFPDKL
jgi:hypothetical protein